MSKTRWDRNKAARTQHWDSDYVALTGGLDQNSPALSIKPGRLAQCINFEEVFGQQGYRFIKGYERFDGRSRPSQTQYKVLEYTAGGATGAPLVAVGDVITNLSATASAVVAQNAIEVGAWGPAGGGASGHMILVTFTGEFLASDTLIVGGLTVATATEDEYSGSIAYEFNSTAVRAAREFFRAKILPPVGVGSILGGAVFNNTAYVVRNADATKATLWKSSSAGWVSVRTGLAPDATYRFEDANFTGSPSSLKLYGVSGKGRLFSVTSADVFAFTAPIFGSESTSITSLTIGLGAKTFTVIEATRNYVAGDAITAHSTTDWGQSMAGTVTSYNSGTGALVVNVTSVTGAGTFASWEIGKTDFSDKPFMVAEHRNHLWLAYPKGQLQTSNLGDPTLYTSTAALFGMGQEIVGMQSLKGKVLTVFCSGKYAVIQGASAADWVKTDYSKAGGALIDTVQENNGDAIFLGLKGVTTMQATQSFGDFQNSIFSQNVKKTLDALRSSVIGSRMASGNYQYRLYFDTGDCLRFTVITGNPVILPKDVSATLSRYDDIPTCLFGGVINDEERMFFGTSSGYLMEEDVGTSYDGVAIDYVLRLPYNHMKSPAVDKQLHKIELELDSTEAVDIGYRALFDYDDGTYEHGGDTFIVVATGGRFDVNTFDTFAFNAPDISRAEASIDGECRNMALLILANSDIVDPLTVQGVLTFFTKLGVRP